MNSNKLTWLIIFSMIATLSMIPTAQAETKETRVSIEIIRTVVPIPENYTFPYIHIWKIWCMTGGIGDWAVATNRTRAELADVEIPEGIDDVMFKMYIHENTTGWFVNPYVYGPNTPYNTSVCGATPSPWISSAFGDNASYIYDNVGGAWGGPVDTWKGVIIGGTELSSSRLTYTSVINLPMGHHEFFISAFTKDVVFDGVDKLVEQWVYNTDTFPIYLHQPPEADDDDDNPLSLAFGILSILALSYIAMKKRN
jgi:hypothetical protein